MTFGHFLVILEKMRGEIAMKKVELNKKKKQDALLNTAYHLFTEKGFQKTSISDIVNEAGVAKGTFYLYFKDKLDIRYKLIAKKSAEVFKHAYQKLQKQSMDNFEDKLIFIVDQVIESLNDSPTLLKLISKHLSWGMFKNSLVEPIDDAQRNIYDIYMDLLKNSGYEFDHPEVMIYMIIEIVAGSCYNVILTKEPVPIDELKPYLYQSIRLIIKNHIIS